MGQSTYSIFLSGKIVQVLLAGFFATAPCCVWAELPAKYQKPDDDTVKKQLTAEEYYVTQQEGTEAPFKNRYWDNHEAGIYVDVVTGEPLFSSLDKFDSGTGWPSFSRPINPESLKQKSDRKFLMERTEVRSAGGDSHLGHVFKDGPGPEGNRFCINSSALRFVPLAQLEKEGYGEYLTLFNVPKIPEK